MNTPLTAAQVEALPMGLTITRALIGRDKQGRPIYYPNNRERRAMAHPPRRKNCRGNKLGGRNTYTVGTTRFKK